MDKKQVTLTVATDAPALLRHAATMLRALGEILPIALGGARLHLRHEARELNLLARAIERETGDA